MYTGSLINTAHKWGHWVVSRERWAKFYWLFIILYCDLALKLNDILYNYYNLLNSNFLPSIKHDSSRILSRLNYPFSFPLKRMCRFNRHDGNDAFLVWSFLVPYYSATQEYKNNVNRRSCHPCCTKRQKQQSYPTISNADQCTRELHALYAKTEEHASWLCLRAV